MKKKISIKDIAQEVGVSVALVSYVLSGKEKQARVGKEIAEVIRATAKRMDYQPNQLAKSLKSGKSQTIGLIVADISNPFFSNLARTVEDEAQHNGYTVIFGSSDEKPERSWNLINVLINRQVDGFIIAPTEKSEEQIDYLTKQNIPFVLIDRYFPGISSNYVVTDNYQASYMAVQQLLKAGRKKIGMIAYNTSLIHMQDRKRGYTDAVNSDSDAAAPLIKEIDISRIKLDVELAVQEFMEENSSIDAIFFASNTLALHGLKYLNHTKFRIPEDLEVLCFDEGDAFDFFYAPIRFINQPLVEVGKEAVRILIDQIADKDQNKRQLVISSKLAMSRLNKH